MELLLRRVQCKQSVSVLHPGKRDKLSPQRSSARIGNRHSWMNVALSRGLTSGTRLEGGAGRSGPLGRQHPATGRQDIAAPGEEGAEELAPRRVRTCVLPERLEPLL